MPQFSVIIVNYNGGALLSRCVDALLAQSHAEFEAVLWDNGSTDGSLEGLPDDPRLRVVAGGENLGFAEANNRAAAMTAGDWVVTLNPDAFAAPDWLAALARSIRRNPGVALLGSMQIMADETGMFDGAGDEFSVWGIAYRARHGHPVKTATTDFPVFGPCAAAAAYRRDVWDALEGFDARFFCFHEDVDLALRARRMGERAVQVHDATVHHVGGGLSGSASAFSVYHGTRNRVWTWVGSMPLGLMLGLMPLTVAANLGYLAWSAFRPGRFKPTARGLWHGVRGAPAMIRTRQRYVRRGTVAPMLVWNPASVLRRRNKSWRS